MRKVKDEEHPTMGYPEIGHFEMQNRLDTYLFDSQNTV